MTINCQFSVNLFSFFSTANLVHCIAFSVAAFMFYLSEGNSSRFIIISVHALFWVSANADHLLICNRFSCPVFSLLIIMSTYWFYQFSLLFSVGNFTHHH